MEDHALHRSRNQETLKINYCH